VEFDEVYIWKVKVTGLWNLGMAVVYKIIRTKVLRTGKTK
jgi:hypothetical protein